MKTPEISIVMPCLNEERGIGVSVKKAKEAIKKNKLSAEIIVSDNGSTDNSVIIAKKLGARIVFQKRKGYGAAYLKGLSETKGKYIVMGDSDATYDFKDIPKFVKPLQNGFDVVMGSRFKGKILKGAMSWSHRYIGNPILSGMLRIMFGTSVSDSHCGMRSFTRKAYKKMDLKTTGMEFASEMVVKALYHKLKIAEVPITYHPRKGDSKLVGLKDAWRHLRFMLMYSPNYLFLLPGSILFITGFVSMLILLRGPIFLFNHGFDLHVLTLASLFTILGFQIIISGFYAKIFAFTQKLNTHSRLLELLFKYFNLEKGLLIGVLLVLIGIVINIAIFTFWANMGYGELEALRPEIFASTIIIIGFQMIFSSFLFSIMGLMSRND